MTHVTCRLTAKDRDQLRNPTLWNQYGLYLQAYLFNIPLETKKYIKSKKEKKN